MTQQPSQQPEFGKLKERLRKNSLTADDIRTVEELISKYESKGEGSLGTIAGRPIIARLPGGLDVLK